MKIEFSLVGDGTNIEVSLLEMIGNSEVVEDRFYTATHTFPLCMIPDHPKCNYSKIFYDLEEVMEKPKIGGPYSHLHPYWYEREERRKRRFQILESSKQ